MVRSPQSSAVPHPSPGLVGGCWGGRCANAGTGQAQGGPLGGSQAPGLTLSPLHRRGNGAPREAGMSRVTHKPSTQWAADMTKLGAMRVAPQK